MNNPREDGWELSGANNDTYTHKDRDERVTFVTGDSGTVYIKDISGSYNGLTVYDSEKHGTPNK